MHAGRCDRGRNILDVLVSALRHALLSFIFVAIVLAVTINMVADLAN